MNTLFSTHAISYQNMVFRNIFTCSPSQDLFDDVSDPEAYEFIHGMVELTSGIDHQEDQKNRPFQYAQIEDHEILAVFQKEQWSYGRFGDGQSFGVFYSAEDELTSVYESSYNAYRLAQDNTFLKGEVYTTDRTMYSADLGSDAALDLTQAEKYFNQLVHPVDFQFCQRLSISCLEKNFDLLRTPSARRVGGVCVPALNSQVISEVFKLYSLSIHVHPNGVLGINSSHEEINLSLKGFEIEDPYGILNRRLG